MAKRKTSTKKRKKKAAPKETKPTRRLTTGDALHTVRAERRALQEIVFEAMCLHADPMESPSDAFLIKVKDAADIGIPGKILRGEVCLLSSVPDLDMLALAKTLNVDLSGVKITPECWKKIYPTCDL